MSSDTAVSHILQILQANKSRMMNYIFIFFRSKPLEHPLGPLIVFYPHKHSVMLFIYFFFLQKMIIYCEQGWCLQGSVLFPALMV